MFLLLWQQSSHSVRYYHGLLMPQGTRVPNMSEQNQINDNYLCETHVTQNKDDLQRIFMNKFGTIKLKRF